MFSGKLRIVFHSDASHGWYQVPRGVLVESGCAEDITPYSYQRGDQVYLEEDCDAGTFFTALRNAGVPDEALEIIPRDYGRSPAPLRHFESFTFDPALGV